MSSSSSSLSSLRQALRQLDGSAMSIQRAAAAMMKHYDQQAQLAVTEWRNCLLSRETRRDQLLPLLYVANEILQNSKRNRGNNFLKAFAPQGGAGSTSALGPALRHICAADRSLTEKVRRTVKIWGDRRVFSRRFVNELLTGLEPYRQQLAAAESSTTTTTAAVTKPSSSSSTTTTPVFRDEDDATFSPQPDLSQESNTSNNDQDRSSSKGDNDPTEDDDDDDDNDDDLMEILENENKDGDDDDDDDDEDVFASSQGAKLQLSIDLESATNTTAGATGGAAAAAASQKSKRRRSSTGSHSTAANSAGTSNNNGPGTHKKKSRRSSSATGSDELSTTDLVDLWNRVSSLQQRFDLATLGMERIQAAIRKKPDDDLENLVGDQLQEAWQETLKQEEQYLDYRQQLREIAVERKQLQQKATSYLSWLKQSLQQDTEDIAFCHTLHDKISTFKKVHERIRWAHNLRQKEEEQRQEKLQEQERLRREREENERFRRAALQKQTEGGAGMVWNPTTREYQPLNTEESWRD